jgi:hypothetical protein
MAKDKYRRKQDAAPSPFDAARDELFQHIMKCGVIEAAREDQAAWFDDTIGYLADRYHELSDSQIAELRVLGERFCQPPKAATQTAEAVGAA